MLRTTSLVLRRLLGWDNSGAARQRRGHGDSGSSRRRSGLRLVGEQLEDRRMLAAGDFLQTLVDPNTLPQMNSGYGYAVATNGTLTVVGAPNAGAAGQSQPGAAYIFDTASGGLLKTINNPTPAAGDQFGAAVALAGNELVIAAPNDSTAGTNSGSVYVFDATTGSLQLSIGSPTPATNAHFGAALALDGTTLVASGNGNAYVLDATTGNPLGTLTNPNFTNNGGFGSSLAISGGNIVVGVPTDDSLGTGSGEALVYDTTGSLLRTIANPKPAANAHFGASVAISGDNVVVGAPGDSVNASNAGAVYEMDLTTGSLVHALKKPNIKANDQFGTSLAMSGTLIVVGVPNSGGTLVSSGNAYVYDATSASLVVSVANPAPAAYDRFGAAVAVSGTTVVVGTSQHSVPVPAAGIAYEFNATSGAVTQTLTSPVPAAGDMFGQGVAVSGNIAVVGSPNDDTAAVDAGVVRLYDATSGNLLLTIADPAAKAGDHFGASVAIQSGRIVVGAPNTSVGGMNAGRAYLYDTSGNLLGTITKSSPLAGDLFGSSVALDSGTIVIGAPGDGTAAASAGAAYIFGTGNLTSPLVLVSPLAAASDKFGTSVAISGTTIVVGSPYDDSAGTDAGAAYVFMGSSLSYTGRLIDPNPAAGKHYGTSVSVSGSLAAVGAPNDSSTVANAGAAYVFNLNTWTVLRTIANPNPGVNDKFGSSLSLSADGLAVGAPYNDTGAADAGVAYLYDVSTGGLIKMLYDPNPGTGDLFGAAVAMSGSRLIVGAPGAAGTSVQRGAADLFEGLGYQTRFDFGSAGSPIATYYAQVTDSTNYANGFGYGWISGTVFSAARGAGDALTSDFVYTQDATFAADLPSGYYQIKVTMGDMGPFGHDRMAVWMEGQTVDTVLTAPSQVVTRTYEVLVTGGQLQVRLQDLGGGDPCAVIEALDVQQVADRVFDFGPTTTPAQDGTTAVSEATTFSAARGFGWVTGAVMTYNRGTGNALDGTFAYTTGAIFVDNVANGTYLLTLDLGDQGPYAHDQMGIYIQGQQYDIVSTAAGEVVHRTYQVTVNGGQIDLALEDLGGGDPCVVIEALRVRKMLDTTFDFGPSGAPLAADTIRATAATNYTDAVGYGWTSGTVQSWDRGTADPLTRDFIYTPSAEFSMDVPNGTYTVSAVLGDTGNFAHDQMTMLLNDTSIASVSTAANEVVTRTGQVTVTDGRLRVGFNDAGGSDPNVVVEGLRIQQVLDTTYDFGTSASPLAAGTQKVTEAANYSSLRGYGWTSGTVSSWDRALGGDLTRDFVYTSAATFSTDLPDGLYLVTVTLGDPGPHVHDNMQITANGQSVASISTLPGQVVSPSARVIVANHQLTISLQDGGGGDPNVVVEAIRVQRVFDTTVDFGPSTSPVQGDAVGVNESTGYSLTRGLGWQSGALASADRGAAAGTALTRDFVYGPDATFGMDLPNGSYQVEVTLGDPGNFAHDQMGVFLEGTSAGTVSTTAHQVVANDYVATVNDGQLTIELRDLGGTDPNVVCEGIRVTSLGSPLMAADGATTPAADAGQLTADQAQPLLAAAVAAWQAGSLPSAAASRLGAIQVVVSDLPGAEIGLAQGNTIYLDANAAGHGWFVDATPQDSSEFQAPSGNSAQAVDPQAVSRIDLLSVLEHEVGHVLGLSDQDLTGGLMNGGLKTGTRVFLSPADLDLAVAQGVWG